MCVRLTGSREAMDTFFKNHRMPFKCTKREGDTVVCEVFVSADLVEGELKKIKGLDVEVLYDASARGRERQKEVGQGNRFQGKRALFKGLGGKTTEVKK